MEYTITLLKNDSIKVIHVKQPWNSERSIQLRLLKNDSIKVIHVAFMPLKPIKSYSK